MKDENGKTFGQKLVSVVPLLTAGAAVAIFDGGFTFIKTSGLTIAGVAKTVAIGAAGYATAKVIMTPDYNARLEVAADELLAKMTAKFSAQDKPAAVKPARKIEPEPEFS